MKRATAQARPTSAAGARPRPIKQRQEIQLPTPPSANDRLTIAKDRNTGKHRAFLTTAVRQYRRGIAQLLCFLKPVPEPIDVRVTIHWHLAGGDSGDTDNRLKIALDALTGHAYDDDRQIAELHVYRIRGALHPLFNVMVEALNV